jgi:hypothetical protein
MTAPELPPSQMNVEVWDSEVQGLHQANAPYFTADQMHAFYRLGFAAGLEAAAVITLNEALDDPCDDAGDIAYNNAVIDCYGAIRAACAAK